MNTRSAYSKMKISPQYYCYYTQLYNGKTVSFRSDLAVCVCVRKKDDGTQCIILIIISGPAQSDAHAASLRLAPASQPASDQHCAATTTVVQFGFCANSEHHAEATSSSYDSDSAHMRRRCRGGGGVGA